MICFVHLVNYSKSFPLCFMIYLFLFYLKNFVCRHHDWLFYIFSPSFGGEILSFQFRFFEIRSLKLPSFEVSLSFGTAKVWTFLLFQRKNFIFFLSPFLRFQSALQLFFPAVRGGKGRNSFLFPQVIFFIFFSLLFVPFQHSGSSVYINLPAYSPRFPFAVPNSLSPSTFNPVSSNNYPRLSFVCGSQRWEVFSLSSRTFLKFFLELLPVFISINNRVFISEAGCKGTQKCDLCKCFS